MLGKLNPFIRFIDKIESASLVHETVAHDCRLIYVLCGCCDILFEGEHHHIEENDTVYLPPYMPYAVRNDTDGATLLTVHFDLTSKYEEYAGSLRSLSLSEFAVCKRLEQEVFAPFEVPFVVQNFDVRSYLDAVQRIIVLPSAYARNRASAAMKEILLVLAEKHESDQGLSPLTKTIVDYVYAHFADAEVTNQDIAARFGYHPYHISRVMRAETGQTLKAFIISYRLKVAVNMLALTDMAIADIARSCGFESQSYFSKMFREEFHMTPGDYRKAHSQRRF